MILIPAISFAYIVSNWKYSHPLTLTYQVFDEAFEADTMNKDMVTKNLDLARAVIELVGTPNSISRAGSEIIEWLGRERINKPDYLYCLEKSRALAHPNEQGLLIQDQIKRSEAKISKAGGLQLIRSASIGRWMAFSEDHSYLVTTVASIARYQDLNYAVDSLSQMMLAGPTRQRGYNIQQSRLKGVLRKVCESIALHVINPGHSVGELPPDLSSMCLHHCNPSTFSDVVMKITQSKHDILLYCERFQAGILSWLLAHFQGAIEVSVGGKRLFETRPDTPDRCLTMLVQNSCVDESCEDIQGRIEVCEKTGESWTRIMFGVGSHKVRGSGNEGPPNPFLREPIYDTKTGYFRALNKEAKFRARSLAHRMVKWLLGVTIESLPDTCLLAFRTLKNEKERALGLKTAPIRIGDLLYRWPRSGNPEFGDEDDSSPARPIATTIERLELAAIESEPLSLDIISKTFPAVEDFLKTFKKKCACPECEGEHAPVDFCRPGCLRQSAVSYLFLLIGNTIADGFGIDDVSGMTQIEEYVVQTRLLLSQLLQGLVLWNTWFNLAACTILGYTPWLFRDSIPRARSIDQSGSALVAVQYGALVAAASWTDLTKELALRGCFRLESATGSLLGVVDEQAFMRTEMTMQLMDMSEPSTSTEISADLHQDRVLRHDDSSLKIDSAIVSTEYNYRLLTIVSTEHYQRVVDPAFALLSLARSLEVHCEHQPSPHRTGDLGVQFQTIDTIFGTWDLSPEVEGESISPENPTPLSAAYILDDNMKFNCILGLCVNGCLLLGASGCMECAAKAAEAAEALDLKIARRIVRRPVHTVCGVLARRETRQGS
jgi:hypothetical protein